MNPFPGKPNRLPPKRDDGTLPRCPGCDLLLPCHNCPTEENAIDEYAYATRTGGHLAIEPSPLHKAEAMEDALLEDLAYDNPKQDLGERDPSPKEMAKRLTRKARGFRAKLCQTCVTGYVPGNHKTFDPRCAGCAEKLRLGLRTGKEPHPNDQSDSEWHRLPALRYGKGH